MKISMEFLKPGQVTITFQDAGSETKAIVQQKRNGCWQMNTKGIEEDSFIGLVISDLAMGDAIAISKAFEALKEESSAAITEKLPDDVLESLSSYLD